LILIREKYRVSKLAAVPVRAKAKVNKEGFQLAAQLA
jgi:hypothetical protein